MSTTDLIDALTVRKFVELVHEHAAAAIHGLRDPRPCVLHLCSLSPDDRRFNTSAYNIGDVDHMTADALADANAGRNVFIEPRLVRPSKFANERGKFEDTMAVFGVVADSDRDNDKPFIVRTAASILVETSPANRHHWYLLRRAIAAGDAQELGQQMRDACGGDHCSGNPVQPLNGRAAAWRWQHGSCARPAAHSRPQSWRNGLSAATNRDQSQRRRHCLSR